jgi:hypothetical protein
LGGSNAQVSCLCGSGVGHVPQCLWSGSTGTEGRTGSTRSPGRAGRPGTARFCGGDRPERRARAGRTRGAKRRARTARSARPQGGPRAAGAERRRRAGLTRRETGYLRLLELQLELQRRRIPCVSNVSTRGSFSYQEWGCGNCFVRKQSRPCHSSLRAPVTLDGSDIPSAIRLAGKILNRRSESSGRSTPCYLSRRTPQVLLEQIK